MLTSEVLNKAADLIEERGWGQGPNTWGDEPTEHTLCVEGGILAAMGGEFEHFDPAFVTCPAYRAVRSHLEGRYEFLCGLDQGGRLWDWNDDSDRTQAEVIEVLRAAAAIEQAREAQPAVVTA